MKIKANKRIKWLKLGFFLLIVKPLVLIGLGLNIVNRQKLPTTGPLVIVANHTSHLDTLVLMSLLPLKTLNKVRPIAAADYFMRNPLLRWFSTYCIDIIPFERKAFKDTDQLFSLCHQCLDQGDILILFPEGTRSSTEVRTFKLKRGIHLLMQKHPNIPVIPIILRGLGRALPKGEALFVPFNCDVIIGDPIPFQSDSETYLTKLEQTYQELLKMAFTQPNA